MNLDDMFTTYRVRWDFITQLCASVPGRSNLIEGWLNARSPNVRPPATKGLDEVTAEVLETLATPEEEEQPSTLVFQRVNGILAVRVATIKAHMKDCAYQIQVYTAGYLEGEKSLRVKVANNVYWPNDRPPVILLHGTPFVPILDREGQPFKEPNGVRVDSMGDDLGQGPREKAIHVNTPQGQRSALKAFEFCEGATIEFLLSVTKAQARQIRRGKEVRQQAAGSVVSLEDLEKMFLYGGMHGYGGERSEDGGRYAATIEEVKV